MPTSSSQANTSMLRNSDSESVKEKADFFTANVSIMMQDQCLGNGHQTENNNKRSLSCKVSDDLNNSKNSIVSNGVSNVKEFNADVNSEKNADLVIKRNRAVDAESPPTDKVLSKSKYLAETASKLVGLKNNIETNKSKCADMTVITHQNSSENLRDFIANSEKANKNSSESQLTLVEKNVKSDSFNASQKYSVKLPGVRHRKLIRSANVNECEENKPEDPIERLNKLRASISSALSEVKGVLKQYSTEQNCDEQDESNITKKPLDDGPVRFRFVRKIRRRSVFSEEDESEVPNTSSPIVEKKVVAEDSTFFKDKNEDIPVINHGLLDQNITESKIIPELEEVKTSVKKDKKETEKDLVQKSVLETTAQELRKTTDIEAVSIDEIAKIKNGKSKKNPKKGRRASVAAVEVIQVPNDQSSAQLELKTQRRLSDSGAHTNAKITVKSKLLPNRKTKAGHITCKTGDLNISSNQELQTVGKTDTVSGIIKDETIISKSKSKETRENSISKKALVENEKEAISDKFHQSTEKNNWDAPDATMKDVISLAITNEVSTAAETPISLCTKAEANTPELTNIIKQNISEAECLPTNTLFETTLVRPELKMSNENSQPNLKTSKLSKQINEPTTISAQVYDSNKSKTQNKNSNKSIAESNITIDSNNLLTTETELFTPSNQIEKMSSQPQRIKNVCIKSLESEKVVEKIVDKNITVESPTTKITKAQLKPTTVKKINKETQSDSDKRAIQTDETSDTSALTNPLELCGEMEVPKPVNVPKDALAVKLNLPGQESVDELQRLEQQNKETSPSQIAAPTLVAPKKKRKAKRKVVIRRIKRKLSKDDTFLLPQEAASELEICEKEIEEKDLDEEPDAEGVIEMSKGPKSCLKVRQFEIGDVVMYAEHYKKTQVRWKKAVVTERITSISYKLNINGEERPAHISYIKKFTDRKVNFGGKEYLEIDYAQIEEDEEKERNYSIWNLV